MEGRRDKRDEFKFVIKNNYFVGDGEQQQRSEEQTREMAVNLKRLQEMFADCVDADVVEMIFIECAMNVEKSVESILLLCEGSKSQSNSTTPLEAAAVYPKSVIGEQLNATPVINFASAVKSTMNSNSNSNANANCMQTRSTNVSKECNTVDEITKCIKENVKVIVLMRGLPGSGKSTLANQLVRHTNGAVFSSDDYFTSKNGIYQFDWSKLSDAHDWNQKRSANALKAGISPIFIDNTNLEDWEMKPYVVMGYDNGYKIYFLEPNTHWKYKVGYLSKYNKHSIKKERIEAMKERFDRNVTVERMIANLMRERKHEVQKQKRSNSDVSNGNATEEASPSKIDLDLLMVLNQRNTDSESSSRNTSENGSFLGQEGCWEKDDDFLYSENSEANPNGGGNGSASNAQVNDTPKPQRDRKSKTASACSRGDGDWTPLETNDEKSSMQSQSKRLLGSRQSNNWEFPPFPSEVCVESDEGKEVDRFVYLRSVATQTENMDWALLEIKQNDVESGDIISSDILISKYVFEDVIAMPTNRMSRAMKIDRGTVASEIPGDLTFNEKIAQLKEHFSQAQESHLREVLNACHEDVDWAFNLLSQFSDDHFNNSLDSPTYSSPQSLPQMQTQQESEKSEDIAQQEINASFTLRLEPLFCMQLQNAFGSVTDNSITTNDCQVNISHGVAKLLHHLWKKSISQKQQQLQQQSHLTNGTSHTNNNRLNDGRKVNKSRLFTLPASQAPGSFKEIMDLEMALNLSWNEYYTNENSDEQKELLSTKLKREQLFNTYPGIDRQTLDELFEANGYRLADTIETIDQSCGMQATLTDATEIWVTAETVSNGTKARVKQCIPFDTQPKNGNGNAQNTQRLQEDEMQEIRSKMMQFNRKRKELINKARQSYERKRYAVASYYSSQARDYQNQMDSASKQVIQNILNATTSNKLDLHGLHSSEVLLTVSTYLKWKLEELKRKHMKQTYVDIITGWGAHSEFAPKIKPIVLNYLISKKYKFQNLNAGEVRVTLIQN